MTMLTADEPFAPAAPGLRVPPHLRREPPASAGVVIAPAADAIDGPHGAHGTDDMNDNDTIDAINGTHGTHGTHAADGITGSHAPPPVAAEAAAAPPARAPRAALDLFAAPAPDTRPPGPPAEGLALVDGLLRDQRAVLDRINRGEALGPLVRTAVITIAAAAAVTGAALGAFRGGPQVVYAALKLPLVLLLTAGFTTPALTALDAALTGHRDRHALRRDLAAVLAALALAALLIAATAPIVLLAGMMGAGYHDTILLTVACCAAGGLGGLVFFVRALASRGGGRRLVGVVFLTVCAVVGCQLAWTLRPWVVRPRTVEVPFVRAIEGSFLDAVIGSVDSARGLYWRDEAPMPEVSR